MFCNKCGNEIYDDAVACPNCGCATQNHQNDLSHPSPNVELINYSTQVSSLFTYAILALIFSLGLIGIIFEIMYLGLFKKLPKEVKLITEYDTLEFNRIQSKLNTAAALYFTSCILSSISILACVILLANFI